MDRHDGLSPEPAPTRGPVVPGPAQGHVLDYLRILSKRRWTASAVFLVTVIGVGIYTWSVTPLYQASVKLMIEDERPRVVVFKDAIDQDRDKIDYQQTQVAILQSRGLAKRTLTTLNLWRHPTFAAEGDAHPGRVRRTLNSLVALPAGLIAALSKSKPPPAAAPVEPAAAGDPETAGETRAIDMFLARLSVAPIRNSRMVVVRFTSETPKLAAEIANTLAGEYAKQNVEFKTRASNDAVDWLGSQLEAQRKKVEASQAALQRYREQTEAVSADGRENTAIQKLNELNLALTRARTERIQKEARFKQVHEVQDQHGTVDAVPAIMANAFVQELKAKLGELQQQEAQRRGVLGERHPEMVKLQQSIVTTQARLQGEIAKVVSGLEHDYLAARAEEDALARAVEAQRHDALLTRRKQIEYDALDHAAASDRQIFETLLQRTKETGVSGQGVGSNIRVIDSAEVPRAPVSPRKQLNLLLSICSGLILGAGTAFFVDYLDKSIQTPDELKRQLRLPCLGLVPSTGNPKHHDPLLLTNGVPQRFKESFRTIRSNVVFASTKESARSILVTSTGPNEGKTVVATNLAIALAQTGQRVLIIDGDMRRPGVHIALAQEQSPGLSDVASGRRPYGTTTRESSVPNLWVLTAGATPTNPSELLSSPRLKELLASVSSEFAWVIIDSPPVMAVTDASLIAHLVGGVVFVVAAEQTMGPIAVNALDQLDSANATFVGAVLNRVDLDRNAFFYSTYYRPEYGKYYVPS